MCSYEFLSESKESVVSALLSEHTHYLDLIYFSGRKKMPVFSWLIPVVDCRGLEGKDYIMK